MGDRLRHIHLTDGTGSAKDEHLVPGRGDQPCAELLQSLAGRGFQGSVALEVSTRKVPSRAVREADETFGARIESLNLEQGFIRTTGKGSKTRLVPVGSKARAAIAEYLAHERPRLAAPPLEASGR